jgi:hypothetical protein
MGVYCKNMFCFGYDKNIPFEFIFHCGCLVFKCTYNYTIQYALIHLLFCAAVSLNVYWILSTAFLFEQLKRKLSFFRISVFKIFEAPGHIESCDSSRQTGTEQQGETT